LDSPPQPNEAAFEYREFFPIPVQQDRAERPTTNAIIAAWPASQRSCAASQFGGALRFAHPVEEEVIRSNGWFGPLR
jgi:hypothetical protein